MRRWTQIEIRTAESPDEALLADRVRPLMERLRPRLRTWHYFWEPDLWVRLGWRDDADVDAAHADIERVCDQARADGAIEGWAFGTYDADRDASFMGEEAWPRVERDFENGAELALHLVGAHRDGGATKSLDFHWARHVHTFTNQLKGTWSHEARLCVLQARYRIKLLSFADGNEARRPKLDALAERLDEVLADIDEVTAAEQQLVGRWRERGRPDIAGLLQLPEGFHRDPSQLE